MGKKNPACAGFIGRLLACMWRSVSSLFFFLSDAVLVSAAWDKKEQALCQRNLTALPRSNSASGAPADAKFDFGPYVTSACTDLLSKSSTQAPGWRAT